MKRSLFFCALSFFIGIYASDAVMSWRMSLLAVFVLLLLLAFFRKCPACYGFLVLFLLLGALSLSLCAGAEDSPLAPYVNEYVTVTAEVISDVTESENSGKSSFDARIRTLSFLNEEISLKETVRFSLPKGEPVPCFGQRFRAVCRLALPEEGGEESYALYLKAQGISFVALGEAKTLTVLGDFPLSFREKLFALNCKCGARIDSLFAKDAEVAAVIKAIALGDTGSLSDSFQENLACSGLYHVVSVSGMHVASWVSMFYALLFMLRRNRYQLLFVGLLSVSLLFFMLFTGAAPAVVRAVIMSVMSLLAPFFHRRRDGLTSLGAAALLMGLCNPFVAFDVGFILSFGAVAGLVLFLEPLSKAILRFFCLPAEEGNFLQGQARSILVLLCATLCAQLLVLPVASHLFGYFSLWSFLTNLLTAFLLPGILAGGFLVATLGFVHPVLSWLPACFSYPLAKVFCLVASFFGSLNGGLLTVPAFGCFAFFLFVLMLYGLFQLLKGRRGKMSVSLVSALLLILLSSGHVWANAEANLHFINVGQGDCSLLCLPDKVSLLIDGGGVLPVDEDLPAYDVGREVVLPYLRKQGIKSLDYMIASHPHQDHIGGLDSILDEIPVGTLLVPVGFDEEALGQELLAKAKQKGTQVLTLCRGEKYALSPLCQIDVHLPDEAWLSKTTDDNDNSLVFSLIYGKNRILFMGDLTSLGEAYLAETTSPTAVDLLKVGHHGSRYSTSEVFLAWAKPDYAIIHCGENAFGHPSRETLDRLAEAEVTTYRTDWDKDIRFHLNEESITSIRTGGKSR